MNIHICLFDVFEEEISIIYTVMHFNEILWRVHPLAMERLKRFGDGSISCCYQKAVSGFWQNFVYINTLLRMEILFLMKMMTD